MTLLNLYAVHQNTLDELKQGNKDVLQGMDATMKVTYGLVLQKEFGIADTSSINYEVVGQAFQERLKYQRKTEENRERLRQEHISREANEWARKMAVVRSIQY